MNKESKRETPAAINFGELLSTCAIVGSARGWERATIGGFRSGAFQRNLRALSRLAAQDSAGNYFLAAMPIHGGRDRVEGRRPSRPRRLVGLTPASAAAPPLPPTSTLPKAAAGSSSHRWRSSRCLVPRASTSLWPKQPAWGGGAQTYAAGSDSWQALGGSGGHRSPPQPPQPPTATRSPRCRARSRGLAAHTPASELQQHAPASASGSHGLSQPGPGGACRGPGSTAMRDTPPRAAPRRPCSAATRAVAPAGTGGVGTSEQPG